MPDKITITPEILISIVSVTISVVALVRSRKVAKKQFKLGQEQLKLEKITAELSKKQLELLQIEEISKTKPKLNVTIQPLGKNYCFYITNKGNVNIYHLNFEIINDQDNPLYDAHDKLPLKELRANSALKLRAAFHFGSPSKYEVKLSWQDKQGNLFEELFYPTR